MATYAIGDVQGCWASLVRLLDEIRFRPDTDRLWLVGDLVNRGPASLQVLRFLRGLGDRAVCVLGNHDLHLIARASGLAGPKALDTVEDVLTAPDRDELVDWLARRPLLHREGDRVMVHAGLAPAWTVDDAEREARRLEASIRDPRVRPGVIGRGAYEPALKALTTIRTCRADGTLCKFSGPPAEAPEGCVPWFTHPARQSRGTTVIFGHWAALGAAFGADYAGLDSGCVWGNALTALRLDDQRRFSVPAEERRASK